VNIYIIFVKNTKSYVIEKLIINTTRK
jgi:hypothetical protein